MTGKKIFEFNPAATLGDLTDTVVLVSWKTNRNMSITMGVLKTWVQAVIGVGARYRGIFAIHTAYNVGDIVATEDGSGLWRCILQPPYGVGDPVSPPDSDPEHWVSAEYNRQMEYYEQPSSGPLTLDRTWGSFPRKFNRIALNAGPFEIHIPDFDDSAPETTFVDGDIIAIVNTNEDSESIEFTADNAELFGTSGDLTLKRGAMALLIFRGTYITEHGQWDVILDPPLPSSLILTDLQVNGSLSAGRIRNNTRLYSALPSTSLFPGTRCMITDSTLAYSGANLGSIAAGGGANLAPVYYDGTNWRIG